MKLGVNSLVAFGDSQLVVNQVQGDYLAKDTRMLAHLGEVKNVSRKIKDFKICQIPKEENKKVDALANLALTFDVVSDESIPLKFLLNPSIEITRSVCQTESESNMDGRHYRISPKWHVTSRRTLSLPNPIQICKGLPSPWNIV